MVTSRRLAVVAIAVWGTACGGAESPASSGQATVVDSAGVRIVTNADAPIRWTPGPPVSIGQLEGPPEYTLNRVSGVTVAPDGHVLVLDAGDQAVKAYASDGTYAYTLGGEGDGPSEFRGASVMFWSGDTLSVFDWRGPKLARFVGPDFVDTQRSGVTITEFGVPGTWDPVPGGAVITMGDGCRMPPPEDRRPFWKAMVVDASASVTDTVAMLVRRDVLAIYGDRFCMGAFGLAGPRHELAVRPDGRAAYGTGSAYQVAIFGLDATGAFDGDMPAPETLIRRVAEARPLTETHIEGHRDRYTRPREDGQPVDRDRVGAFEAAWDSLGFPAHFPYFDRVAWDDEGRLWVGESTPEDATARNWAVYAESGELIAEVELPADLTVHAIAHGTVWGTSRDAFDVTYVVGYPVG